MYNSSDEEDECEPTMKPTAFYVLMQPPSKKAKVDEVEPIYIAVIYIRWLKWIDPSEPLYMCPYGGQAVRPGSSAEEVALARWREENSQGIREQKDIGLLACIGDYGPDAFDNQIVEWKRGPRSEVQKWADEREIALIAEHGGPLRDPSVQCKQTLNLRNGGKGNVNFEALDAARTIGWLKFKREMEAYVECYNTSLVKASYVNMSSGYKLGKQLTCVRGGVLWKDHPDEAGRIQWLESLPKWSWDPKKHSYITIKWSKFKQELQEYVNFHNTSLVPSKYVNPLSGYRLGETLAHVRNAGTLWKGHPDEPKRVEWLESLPNWTWKPRKSKAWRVSQSKHRTEWWYSQDERDKQSKRLKALWDNADEEKRAEWCRKLSEARSTPEAKAAQSERSKEFWNSQEARDDMSKRSNDFWSNVSDVKRVEMSQKMSAKHALRKASNRASALKDISESKGIKKQKEFDRNDHKEANRQSRATALLKLSEYADKGQRWCYRNQAQAKREGVVFFKDASGVWCARMGGQGEGSSA